LFADDKKKKKNVNYACPNNNLLLYHTRTRVICTFHLQQLYQSVCLQFIASVIINYFYSVTICSIIIYLLLLLLLLHMVFAFFLNLNWNDIYFFNICMYIVSLICEQFMNNNVEDWGVIPVINNNNIIYGDGYNIGLHEKEMSWSVCLMTTNKLDHIILPVYLWYRMAGRLSRRQDRRSPLNIVSIFFYIILFGRRVFFQH